MSGEVGGCDPTPPAGPYGRWLEWACKVAAIAGALVFCGLVLMSVVSVSGRKLVIR